VKQRTFVAEPDLPPGHIGRKAARYRGPNIVQQIGEVIPTRAPNLVPTDICTPTMEFLKTPPMDDFVSMLKDGDPGSPPPIERIFLEAQTMGWREQITDAHGAVSPQTRHCRFYWYPEEQALYYHTAASPPGWMLERTWRRCMARDAGLIDDLNDELPGEPHRTAKVVAGSDGRMHPGGGKPIHPGA
jgi:hypothetical protein